MFGRPVSEPVSGLSASEAAGSAIRLALGNYRLLISAVAAVLVPTAIIGGTTLGVWQSAGSGPRGGNSLGNPAAVIGLVILVLGNLLAQAVGVYAAVSAAVGGQASWRHSLAVAVRRWSQCLSVGLLVVLGSGLALLAFIVPGVVLFFGWFVAMPVVIIEGHSARSAMARSWELTRGRRLSMLGSYVLVELVIVAGSVPLGVIAGAAFSGSSTRAVVAQQVATYLVEVLLTPLQVALVAVVYLDLRLRKDQTTALQVGRQAQILLGGEHATDDHHRDAENPRASIQPELPLPADAASEHSSIQNEPPDAPRAPRQDVRSGTTWQVSPKPSQPRPALKLTSPTADAGATTKPAEEEGQDRAPRIAPTDDDLEEP